MKNISFAMTTHQFRARTKDVTRRLGWCGLKPGELLQAVEKCQGLHKGEKAVRLGVIRVVSVRREPIVALRAYPYGIEEMKREGFPGMAPHDFIHMFIRANRCDDYVDVTRIEFEYLNPGETRATGRQMTLTEWAQKG